MRAVVAKTFPAYDFAAVDALVMDDLVETYVAALWLGEQEAKQVKGPKPRRRRR